MSLPGRRAAAGLAGCLALVVVLTGCGGSSSDGAAPARSSTTAGPSAATTSTPGTGASTTPSGSNPTTSLATTTVPTKGDLDGVVVVVDPGHNGANGSHSAEINRLVDAGGFKKACNTTGTAEGGLTESRYNWETAQVLRDLLQARGARVVLTRTSDDGWGPCVDQRALTAQREQADVLVSIHADGADASASGFHVITPATGPTVTAANRDASAALAAAVRDALVAQGLSPATYVGGDRGVVQRDDIATVNRAGVPAVMLESGNMHNAGDFAVLNSEDGRRRIATALADAVAAFTIGK